jgi:hypothetical protein
MKFLILLLLTACSNKNLSEPTHIELHPLDYADKVHYYEAAVNQVINSAQFKNDLLASNLTDTRGATNFDVYKEMRQDRKIKVGFFWQDTDLKAYVNLKDLSIMVNLKFFFAGDEYLSSVVLHEIAHVAGYQHNNPPTYNNSVPVTVERIFFRARSTR